MRVCVGERLLTPPPLSPHTHQPGTFWLNPPLRRDAADNWPAGSAPPGRGAALVDPL